MSKIAKKVETNSLISSVEAGKLFGYTNDYVSRLAREKKVIANRVGRQWFIDAASFEKYVKGAEVAKKEYAEQVRTLRKQERVKVSEKSQGSLSVYPVTSQLSSRVSVLAKSGLVLCVGVLAGSLAFLGTRVSPQENVAAISQNFVQTFKHFMYKVHSLPLAVFHVQVAAVQDSQSSSISRQAEDGLRQNTSDAEGASFEGLVILPDTDKKNLEEIKKSFSDPVTVVADPDGQSGVITPEFSHASDTAYRFLMVPIRPP